MSTSTSTYTGHCYCNAIRWRTTTPVTFTSLCHCRDCQTVTGSSLGSTSLMIYDAKGVAFEDEKGVLKIFHAKSERGKATQRGFCGECGSVLFNHVSEGEPDEHWAMRTGSMDQPPEMQEEIFMKSKPDWVPALLGEGHRSEKMPG